jgi:hypothetical protein
LTIEKANSFDLWSVQPNLMGKLLPTLIMSAIGGLADIQAHRDLSHFGQQRAIG